MSLGLRLKQFITKCYDNQLAFADKIDVNQATISRYIRGTHKPDSDCLIRMQDLGLSSDWLLSGIGTMFADNPIGNELRIVHVNSDDDCQSPYKDRMISWIELNYKSIQDFALCTCYDLNKLLKAFEQDQVTHPEILELLEFAGCRTQWILQCSGQMFNDRIMGVIMRKRNNHEDLEVEELIFNKKYSFDDFINSFAFLSKISDHYKYGRIL